MSIDKTLILHGWGGSDYPHWQARLASSLACNYGTVSFPLLENPHFPSKNRWVKQAKEIIKDFKPTVVVAHSLGCILWFWLADEIDIELNKLILVAPPGRNTNIDTIKSFFPYPLPKSLKSTDSLIIASDNDKYIDVSEAASLSEICNTKLQIIPNAGHINSDSGYGKWEYIEKLLERKR
jgi:predicted alpha/beta hydrolase family esterase